MQTKQRPLLYASFLKSRLMCKILGILSLIQGVVVSSYAQTFEYNMTNYKLLSPNTCEVARQYSYDSRTSITIDSLVKYNGIDYKVVAIGERAFESLAELERIYVPKSVVKIGPKAFYGCKKLTTVPLHDKIEKIGDYAFWGCEKFTSVIMPNSLVEMGSYVFADCISLNSIKFSHGLEIIPKGVCLNDVKLEEVVVSDGMRGIEGEAFKNCSQLASMHLPDGIRYLGEFVFSNCKSLKDVNFPSELVEIGSGCFSETNIGYEVVIPDKVEIIPDHCFSGCERLNKITIGEGVKNIGNDAFYGCKNLSQITINDSARPLKLGSAHINAQPVGLFSYLNLKKIFIGRNLVNEIPYGEEHADYSPFKCSYYESYLSDVTIGNSVTELGNYLFEDCDKIEEIELPSSVKNIGYSTFLNCSGLKSINGLHNVAEIGGKGFMNCTNLDNIRLCESLESLGDSVFANCRSLSSVGVFNYPKVTNGLFENCHNLSEIKLSEDVRSIGLRSFANCRSISSMNIPGSVIRILDFAFSGCVSLSSLIFDKSDYVLLFGGKTVESDYDDNSYDGIFKECTLNKLELNRNCNVINGIIKSPFSGMNELNEVEVGEGVTDIMPFFVANATNLKYLKLPFSLRHIGSYAFSDCVSLLNIDLSEGLESIGEGSFYNCYSLKEVNLPNTIKEIPKNAFANCSSMSSVCMSEAIEFIGEDAFVYCESLEKLSLPNNTRIIGNRAFMDCINLSDINLSERIETIGDSSFQNCKKLMNLKIPLLASTIGQNAFKGCSGIKTLEYEAGSGELYVFNGAFEDILMIDHLYLGRNIRCQSVSSLDKGAQSLLSYETRLSKLEIGSNVDNIYRLFSTCMVDTIISHPVIPPTVDNVQICLNANKKYLNSPWTLLIVPEDSYYAYKDAYRWRELDFEFSRYIPQYVVLNKDEIDLEVGKGFRLKATVYPENAAYDKISWYTSDSFIATVDNTGLVWGIAKGEAVITAYCKNVYATCRVCVEPRRVESITLSDKSVNLKVGESVTLTAQVFPESAEDKTVIWFSDNSVVAEVDDTGKVTANSPGNAVITASNGEVKSECNVTVETITVESINLSQERVELKVGENVQLTATVLPEDATDRTVIWKSDNPGIANVDENGNVTGISLGDATITANCGELKSECVVTVVATPVDSIKLSQARAELKVGENFQLTATVLPEDATDKTVVWESDNSGIANVNENGNVTAISLGEATITAICGEVKSECIVSVVATPVESIKLSQEWAELKVGENVKLTATLLPEDATDRTVIWKSDNPWIANVDENGNVTAISLGEATITANCGELKSECVVTVVATPVESIKLSQTRAELKVGENVHLTATVLPEDATDKTVVWESDNSGIANVDGNGNVTGISLGEATITANCGELKSECIVTVVATPVESIKLSQTRAELKVGENVKLTATVLPEDATDKTVIWYSDDSEVATVNDTGLVTAVSIGVTEIKALCGDVTASCIVTVTPILAESLTITPETWNGEKDEAFLINALVLPQNTTDKTLAFDSSDLNIAKVNDEGLVTVVGIGSCLITVSTTDGSNLTASCIVTGVSGVEYLFIDSKKNVDVYDINGILLKKNCTLDSFKQLSSGIYIIHSGNIVKTIYLNAGL